MNNITRNNYEEFFMLYADKELPAAARKEVEAFVAANPDLQQELALFQQFKLSPDAAVVFTGKDALMKQEDSQAISLTNYESFFVLYADDELTNGEKASVEDFVYHHPQLQADFELMQQVRLSADTSIVFENKENLYKKEEDDKVVPFRWWRISAAAMILLMAGAFWLYQSKKGNGSAQGNMAATDLKKIIPQKKNTQPVTNAPQPPLHNTEAKEDTGTNSNAQPVKEAIVTTGSKKDDATVKSISPVNEAAATVKKKEGQQGNDVTNPQTPSTKEESMAYQETNKLTGSTVTSITNQTSKKAAIHTEIAAAASKSVKDQALVYSGTVENDKANAVQAVAINENKLEVLNTSVDTKNSLRGFFRKASRMISKKNDLNDDDSKRKSILIGGFEIAVR